jgi:hypothetical protein
MSGDIDPTKEGSAFVLELYGLVLRISTDTRLKLKLKCKTMNFVPFRVSAKG